VAIILASGSPRRKELLEQFGLKELKIIPARGEEVAPEGAGPEALVEALAEQKAREVAAYAAAGDVVIAADTIVWADGKALGKPHNTEHAAQMLRSLSGREHAVYTGVCVLKDGTADCAAEKSRVFFRSLTEDEIARYIAGGEPMDKAGAYGAQGKGALFVEKIDGDFFNVMGLPLCRLGGMLKKQGVELI